MDLLLRNGLIVTDGLEIQADLAVRDGVVKAIGELDNLAARKTIDCSGMILLPGAVDLGLHLLDDGLFDPASDTGRCDATIDAAVGGVTTLVSTIATDLREDAGEVIQRTADDDSQNARIDFGYHFYATDWAPERAAQARQAIAAGVSSFWVARNGSDSEFPMPTLIERLFESLQEGALIIAPPYDPAVFSIQAKRAMADGVVTPREWAMLCPDTIESFSITSMAGMAAASRCHVLVHGVTSAEALGALRQAREISSRLSACCTAAHLLFTEAETAPRTWPPIRGKADQQALFAALEDGLLSLVTSGHKPRTNAEMSADQGISPAGVATLAHFLPLLHSEGVAKWRLSLGALSLCVAADPAKLAGLYPRKGSLLVGSDADIVLLDPSAQRGATRASGTPSPGAIADPLSAFAFQGAVKDVYLRGHPVVVDGHLSGEPSGRFLTRKMAMR